MMHLRQSFLLFALLVTCAESVCGQATEERPRNALEYPSPNEQFAFRYTPRERSESEPAADEDAAVKDETYDLVEKRSGKVLMSVAESDPDFGPSARFSMQVVWKADSKAFALTAYLTKRGSEVSVYVRDGSTFRAVELPELEVEIPAKLDHGKTTNINSQSAKRWQRDGSLVVEIATTCSGDKGTVTATRTVVLGFDRANKATIRKSSVKVKVEKD